MPRGSRATTMFQEGPAVAEQPTAPEPTPESSPDFTESVVPGKTEAVRLAFQALGPVSARQIMNYCQEEWGLEISHSLIAQVKNKMNSSTGKAAKKTPRKLQVPRRINGVTPPNIQGYEELAELFQLVKRFGGLDHVGYLMSLFNQEG